MDIENVTKSLDTIVDFIVKGASGQIDNLSDEEAKEFENAVSKVVVNYPVETIISKFEPIMNMNILRMNIQFFDNLPNLFGYIQYATEICVKES